MAAAAVARLEIGDFLRLGRIVDIDDAQARPQEVEQPHMRVCGAVHIVEMQRRRANVWRDSAGRLFRRAQWRAIFGMVHRQLDLAIDKGRLLVGDVDDLGPTAGTGQQFARADEMRVTEPDVRLLAVDVYGNGEIRTATVWHARERG